MTLKVFSSQNKSVIPLYYSQILLHGNPWHSLCSWATVWAFPAVAEVIQYLGTEEEAAPGCHRGSKVKEVKFHSFPLNLLETLNDNYFIYGINI